MEDLSGGDEPVNLALAHMRCNRQKNNLIVQEAIDKLEENIISKEEGFERYEEEILEEARLWVCPDPPVFGSVLSMQSL